MQKLAGDQKFGLAMSVAGVTMVAACVMCRAVFGVDATLTLGLSVLSYALATLGWAGLGLSALKDRQWLQEEETPSSWAVLIRYPMSYAHGEWEKEAGVFAQDAILSRRRFDVAHKAGSKASKVRKAKLRRDYEISLAFCLVTAAISLPLSMAWSALLLSLAVVWRVGWSAWSKIVALIARTAARPKESVSTLEKIRNRRSKLRTLRGEFRHKDEALAIEDEGLAKRERELVSSEGAGAFRTRAIDEAEPPLEELPRGDAEMRTGKTAS